jgi:hypothetical protein
MVSTRIAVLPNQQLKAWVGIDEDKFNESHVVADEYFVADGHREPHRLVVRIPDGDRKAEIVLCAVEVDHPELLHAGLVDGVMLLHDADVAEAERLDKGLDHFAVRNGPVGCRAFWRRDQSKLRAIDDPVLGHKRRCFHSLFSLLCWVVKWLELRELKQTYWACQEGGLG